MKKSKTIGELAKALSQAQAEMPQPPKNATNPFFKSKYADLSSVLSTALPVLAKHGIAVSQLVSGHYLETIVMHNSGEFMSSRMPLFLKDQTPQSQGSAISYARRYAFMAATAMVGDEDDDGNAASQHKPVVSKEIPILQPFKQEVDRGTVTDPQLRKIVMLTKELGYKDVAEYQEKEKVRIKALSKEEAMDLIDKLNDLSSLKIIEDAKQEEAF